MGYCKLKCTEGEPQCCICCPKQEECGCDDMDSYEYAEECSNYVSIEYDMADFKYWLLKRFMQRY